MRIIKNAMCLIIATFTALSLAACSGAGYKDGVYKAEAHEFASSGWKEMVEITIEGGKLVDVNWDATYKDDSIPIRKKQYSKSGLYGMLVTGAVGEWYDQAVAAEQYVLEHGADAFSVNSDGYTDSISGCTIHVIEFKELLEQCLSQAKR